MNRSVRLGTAALAVVFLGFAADGPDTYAPAR